MVQSKLLLQFKEIRHFFFERNDGLDLEGYQIDPLKLITTEQVHGRNIAIVKEREKRYFPGFDGALTKMPLFLNVYTADCLPIFFYDPKKKIIGAIHAGWQGLFLGIVKKAVELMKTMGSNPKDIVSSVGPHIGVCCYSVSYQRVLKFKKEKEAGMDVSLHKRKWFLDLEKIAAKELQQSGLAAKNIDSLSICTYCDKRFYSLRREGVSTGRMLNIIGLV